MKKISAREKKLFGVALAAIAAFVAFQFALSPLFEYYDRLRKEIPVMRRDLFDARRLGARYKLLDAEIADVRTRLGQRTKEFNAHDFLSTLARKEGVSLEGIDLEYTPITEDYQEETAAVKLRNVPLGKLVSYLYGIEHSGQLMTVRELNIKPDRDDSEVLDVSFDASTFIKGEKKEETAPGQPPPRRRPRRR